MSQPPPTVNPGHVTVEIPETMLPEVQRMMESHAVDGDSPRFTSILMTSYVALMLPMIALLTTISSGPAKR